MRHIGKADGDIIKHLDKRRDDNTHLLEALETSFSTCIVAVGSLEE